MSCCFGSAPLVRFSFIISPVAVSADALRLPLFLSSSLSMSLPACRFGVGHLLLQPQGAPAGEPRDRGALPARRHLRSAHSTSQPRRHPVRPPGRAHPAAQSPRRRVRVHRAPRRPRSTRQVREARGEATAKEGANSERAWAGCLIGSRRAPEGSRPPDSRC